VDARGRYRCAMPSIHVSEAGARRLVQQAVRDGYAVAIHGPHSLILITTEGTGHVARHLVDEIFNRLLTGATERSPAEVNLINELAQREIRGSAKPSLQRLRLSGYASMKRAGRTAHMALRVMCAGRIWPLPYQPRESSCTRCSQSRQVPRVSWP
jgi:hypothetical protein